MSDVRRAVTIEDLRRLALRRLPRFLGSYVETGAGNGDGVRRNADAFGKYALIPRGLVNVTPLDSSRSLFGQRFSRPFGISAVGGLGLFRPHAEEMLAEAAREANIPFMLSGGAISLIERIARLAPDHTWFQLYAAKDPNLREQVIGRAHDAGVKVLVLTVDYPIANRSEAAARSGVSLATGVDWGKWPSVLRDILGHPGWTLDFLRAGGLPKTESWERHASVRDSQVGIARRFAGLWPPANLVWSDVERIRALWPGKLVVKGLGDAADILQAVEIGADAVTISNHGGNKLDCMLASIDSLAMAKAAVGDRLPLLFDGGIRRGSDVLKALAVGATFCFVGRATLYGVAAGGLAGATRALDILADELAHTQAMIGCSTLDAVRPELAVPIT